MNKPPTRADGTCAACCGGWQCAYHQAEGVREDARRAAMLRGVSRVTRAQRLDLIAARYELESDEFYTARQKAARMLRA